MHVFKTTALHKQTPLTAIGNKTINEVSQEAITEKISLDILFTARKCRFLLPRSFYCYTKTKPTVVKPDQIGMGDACFYTPKY